MALTAAAPVAKPPSSGRLLTGAVGALAFVSVCNTIGVLGHGLSAGLGPPSLLRIALELALSAGLSAWAVVRIRAGRSASGAVAPGQLAAAPGQVGVAASTDAAATEDHGWGSWSDRLPGWLTRTLRWGRWIAALGLAAVAAVTIADQWATLQSAVDQLGDLRWHELRWAVYAEALSVCANAATFLLLLRAGGARPRLGPIVALTLAGNALVVTLPGGVAWAASFSIRQLRRRGVPVGLAVVVPVLSSVLSAAALLLVLALGVDVAGGTGPAAAFEPAAVAVTAGLGVAVVVVAVLGRAGKLPATRFGRRLAAAGVQLSPRGVASAFIPALGNWVLDCACLAGAILAVSGHVPWQGLLVAYALGQIGAALPFTPGGIGVVEGVMSVLLVAYGMHSATAVAAVLLYRIISFWSLVPVGWLFVGAALARRRLVTKAAPIGTPAGELEAV